VSSNGYALDATDPQRLGFLLLTATDLSTDRYVLVRYSTVTKEWRVNVRYHTLEHTAASGTSLVVAMDRAWQWLRAAHVQR
jgi:hypothetical protein